MNKLSEQICKLNTKTIDKLNIQGVIFDMDGVLFDTEKLYERFWCEAAAKMGYKMTIEDVAAIRSTDALIACQTLKKRIGPDFDYDGVKKLRVSLMHEFTEQNGVELKSGVNEILKYLAERKYKIALATTSNQNRARDFLLKGGLLGYFDCILSGDRVTKCKPDPEIYIKAATELGLKCSQCIAVEDSYNGVRSAYSAGCHVFMVPDRDMPDAEMQEKTIEILENIDMLSKYV